MARKSALFGGRTVKVENRSSFDKSFLNMLTTKVGTITPIVRQLVIPSSGRCKIPIHVELPPLATDAYLRTHLKLEAFYVPLRLCYGGFQSWFCGEPVYDDESRTFVRAHLPFGFITSSIIERQAQDPVTSDMESSLPRFAGVGTLSDYFDLRFIPNGQLAADEISVPEWDTLQTAEHDLKGVKVNLFPYINYHLIYDFFYRNKSVARPGFMPQALSRVGIADKVDNASHLPYVASSANHALGVILGSNFEDSKGNPLYSYIDDADLDEVSGDGLLNGHHLYELRQRNFGDDYFTAAKPTAQGSSPVNVVVENGRFTISALRAANAYTEFSENQNYATPDYVQTNMARYGVAPSDAIVQKPVCLGSADFPIYTKSVELNNNAGNPDGAGNTRNPFASNGVLGAKGGNANGNGTFSFDFDVKEPGYIMVMATLVPEANYSSGIPKEMRILINGDESALPDLPVGLLEHIGDEPIMQHELNPLAASPESVFGYVQRYLWHKAGNVNQIHGLFRKGQNLAAFAPQREFDDTVEISQAFLEIPTTALDDVAAVTSQISEYGVMMDCAVELFVSEPLSESALPALVNPASEHGKSIYLINGGSKLS